MELKLDKKYIDEAVQKAVEELKENYIWIPDGMTNGEVIQAIYGAMVLTVKDGKVWVEKIYFPFDEEWWNAPYKAKKTETCKGCLEPCIMYEPDMRACKEKVTESEE